MSVFTRSKLRGRVEELEKQLHNRSIQETSFSPVMNSFKNRVDDSDYVGNDYNDNEKAVEAISLKYRGQAKWGCLQTRTVIDLRSAFILGEGLKIQHTTNTRKEAEKELEWVHDFMRFNDLDGELDQQMIRESEMEGKCAIKIMPIKEPYRKWPGMISARFVSWKSRKYKVDADPEDYLKYMALKWEASGKLKPGDLKESEFIYSKFGGLLDDPNDAQPPIMPALTIIDRLDMALRDLREINRIFGRVTPVFECSESKAIAEIQEFINKTDWKIGKVLILANTKFRLEGPPTQGLDVLLKEIEMCVKMISGVTGIPIHYLGLLDLLKNRATGENTRELIMAATTPQRQTWISTFEELITKAMIMFNNTFQAQKSVRLNPDIIEVDIPQITQEHWDRIERVLIPAANFGIISKDHVASVIPGVDAEKESELRQTREAGEKEEAAAESRLLFDRLNQDEKDKKTNKKPEELNDEETE